MSSEIALVWDFTHSLFMKPRWGSLSQPASVAGAKRGEGANRTGGNEVTPPEFTRACVCGGSASWRLFRLRSG